MRIHRIYLTWPQHRCGHHCCGFETIDQIGVNNRDGLNCKPLYFLFETCLRFMGQHNSSNIGSVKTLPLFGARPIRFLSWYGTQSVTYVAFGYTLHSLLIQSFKTKMSSTFWFLIYLPIDVAAKHILSKLLIIKKTYRKKRQKLKQKTNDGILENLLWSTQTKINNWSAKLLSFDNKMYILINRNNDVYCLSRHLLWNVYWNEDFEHRRDKETKHSSCSQKVHKIWQE